MNRYLPQRSYATAFIFDSLRTNGLQSVILVISPLVAIIKDQVRKHPSGCNHGTRMHIVLLADRPCTRCP